MTTRERWVLYPLLFLSLGIALRDKMFRRDLPMVARTVAAEQLAADRVQCNRLEVGRAECRVMMVSDGEGHHGLGMGLLPDGTGRLEILAKDGAVVVAAGADQDGSSGWLETSTADGIPLVQLHSSRTGGLVTTFGRRRRSGVFFGRMGSQIGLFAQISELGHPFPLILSRWLGFPAIFRPSSRSRPADESTPVPPDSPPNEGSSPPSHRPR